jgi:hypothetical protein
MIRLKQLLREDIDWNKPFSLSTTDPWEYWHDPADGKLYTRKRGATKWIDMQAVLTPGQYDKAYGRIKDIVSGFKPGGVQTGSDGGQDKKLEKAFAFIKANTPSYVWEVGITDGGPSLTSMQKHGDVIACAWYGKSNTKGWVYFNILSDSVHVIVPEQYKWYATKILNKIGSVDWDNTNAAPSGTTSFPDCENHPMHLRDFVNWRYKIDVINKYKELVVALNLMANWNAVDTKK